MEGSAKTGGAVAGLDLTVGRSLWLSNILFLVGLFSSSLLPCFPLSLPPESFSAGLELGNFRFFDGFACEIEDLDAAGWTVFDLKVADFETGFFSSAVSVAPELSESSTNSELSESFGTVAGFAAFALGFFAGNEAYSFGPAMASEACELYPCLNNIIKNRPMTTKSSKL